MRIHILLPVLLLLSLSHSQTLQPNTVTAIEIYEKNPDTVIIKWKSNAPEGQFALYTDNTIISDQFALFASDLIISSNFTGVQAGSSYQYEYEFSFRAPGLYYFAVVPGNSAYFDQVARSVVNEFYPSPPISLVPEMNTTIQPFYVAFARADLLSEPTLARQDIVNPIITALELVSSEDTFQLRWSVYPKDMQQYIFKIYRSRYPIVQYGTPLGLPAYITLTNQFAFEDRNIGFDEPYYYAVVPEGTVQWNPGINVFSQPAVLLRKSPPFRIQPTVEYVKKTELFSVNYDADLTEAEINLAVQQTLSNLYIKADDIQITLTDILGMDDAEVLYRSSSLTMGSQKGF